MKNKKDALRRIVGIFKNSANIPKKRIKTKVPLKSHQNRIETKKKSTQPNKNKIELAKNECSELGIETGTEKFADCVLQLSK